MEKLKRRTAIKSLGALSLGIAVPSLSKGERLVEPYETKQQSISTDILVVGGGTAGTIAAIQAGRAGARTVLIECGSQLVGHDSWMKYADFTVATGQSFIYEFPDYFQARWIRFKTDKDCEVTTRLDKINHI